LEYLIFAVLVFIAYELYKISSNSEKTTKEISNDVKTSITKSPAFSEDEWDSAVADWIEAETQRDLELGIIGKPGYHIWIPPDYEEVKYDASMLKKLKIMAGK